MVARKKKKIVKKIAKKTVKKSVPTSLKLRRTSKKKAVKKSIKKVVKRVALKSLKKKVVRRAKKPVEVVKKLTALNLHKKHGKNPIMEPQDHIYWESRAAFNPTAIEHQGKVHIMYRAIGDSDNSVVGYAQSHDGLTIIERHPNAIYSHHKLPDKNLPIANYASGGGWGGGCEDAKATLLEDKVYLTYTAFDGWGSIRVAMTCISLDDFLEKKWKWREPVLISPPGEFAKNWAVFPEKVNGKYAILHALTPEIRIEYVDSLDEFDGKNRFIKSVSHADMARMFRENGIRGAGPSPIKTPAGWLVLYHAMEKSDLGKYKLWAMLLDLKDPTQILCRSTQPILEPDQDYENNGHKHGVVYSCGAIVKDGDLFVYYGGSDKVSCVATANLDDFLKELKTHKVMKLKQSKPKAKV